MAETLGDLRIEDNQTTGSPRNQNQDVHRLLQSVTALKASIQQLSSEAHRVKSLVDGEGSSVSLSVQNIISIQSATSEIEALSEDLRTQGILFGAFADDYSLENAILERLLRTGIKHRKDSSAVYFEQPKLLGFFRRAVCNVIRSVISTGEDDGVLRKVADKCHVAMSHPGGPLHPGLFVSHVKAKAGRKCSQKAWTCDDELRTQSQINTAICDAAEWYDFWTGLVGQSEGGPTLFSLPRMDAFTLASRGGNMSQMPEVAPYLFRTYDNDSAGINDQHVIVSPRSSSCESSNRPADILSTDRSRSLRQLNAHLNPPKGNIRNTDSSDNLVSWTSSLLFAIQYAVWKVRLGADPSDIKICAVDTRMFPRGQFAHDKWLIETCNSSGSTSSTGKHLDLNETSARELFRLPPEDERLNNGEFLSQGEVHITGRSCTTSLADLENAGLYQLYPEMLGGDGWTDRLKELRDMWSNQHETTLEEKRLVDVLGRRFVRGSTLDHDLLSLILLCFKDRGSETAPHSSSGKTQLSDP